MIALWILFGVFLGILSVLVLMPTIAGAALNLTTRRHNQTQTYLAEIKKDFDQIINTEEGIDMAHQKQKDLSQINSDMEGAINVSERMKHIKARQTTDVASLIPQWKPQSYVIISGEEVPVKDTKFLDISEGLQGEDMLTFEYDGETHTRIVYKR
jgi:hypothetical protein